MTTVRRLLIDTVAVTVLVCLPSLGLVGVYGGWAPVLVWTVGAVVSASVVLLVAALSRPFRLAIPVVALLFAAAGPSLAGLHPRVPSGAAVAELARGAVSGWHQVLTVAVPTGSSGGLLVPPLLCGVLGGLAGAMLARTRWYPAALGPVLVVGVLAGLIGAAHAPAGVVAALVPADLLIGLGWLVVRRGERRLVVGPRSTRWRRPITAGLTLVVAAGSGLGVVALTGQGERLALRTELAVPVDPVSLPSPLSEFRQVTVDQRSSPLLTVSGVAPGHRLRLAALDGYDGHLFTATAMEGPFSRIGARREPAATGTAKDISITVQGWRGGYLPATGDLQTIDFAGPRADLLTESFRYSGVAMTGVLPGGATAGDGWRQRGIDAAVSAGDVPQTDRIADGDWPATAPIPDPLRAAALKWTDGLSSPAQQLAALTKVLADNGYYSQGRSGQLRSPSGHGLNRLLDMVSGVAMVGDAEQYSVLLAVLARSLGIPARVVVGFTVPAGGAAVTGSDLSAWVEVRFAASGWVAYDPTPRVDRTELETEPQTQAGRHVADNQPPPAAANGDSAQVQADDSAQRPDRGQDPHDPKSSAGRGFPWWAWVLIGLGGLSLVVSTPPAVLWWLKRRRRRKRFAVADPAARTRAAWRELLDVAADAGMSFGRDRTRGEVGAELERLGVPAGAVAQRADLADFSPQPPPAAADQQWQDVDRAAATILARLSARDRWRARMSPSSLRSR